MMPLPDPRPEPTVALDARTFCDAQWGPLVGVLTVKLGDREVATELAQEALARAWERWPEVSVMDHPDRWVFRVALNLASSWIRRRAAERRARQRLRAGRPDPGRHLATAEVVDLRDAVRSLPKREREVITLRYYGDRSVADVAELLGISEGTVKAAAHAARNRLRSRLELGEAP